MEIVSIEKKTFEEMKERFGCFSQHVRELCARYRPPSILHPHPFPQRGYGTFARVKRTARRLVAHLPVLE